MTPEQEFLGKLGFALGLTFLGVAVYGLACSFAAMLPPRRRPHEPGKTKPTANAAAANPRPVCRPVRPGPLWQNSRMFEETQSRGRAATGAEYLQTEPLPEVDVDPRERGRRVQSDDSDDD